MKTVLIVDDEKSLREMVAEMLQSKDLDTVVAESGIQALKILAVKDIDLVVTDIVMPDENGIDLIMDMKTKYASTPIVAISGGGGIEGRFNYLEIAKLVGADQILEKPFSAQELSTVVNELLM